MKGLAGWRAFAALAVVCSLAAACGGGGGGGSVVQPLSVSTVTMPDGVNNSLYSATLASTGGTGAKTWAVTTGSLPAGLTLNGSTGVINGTPTTTNTAGVQFTVTVTDAASPPATATRQLTIRVFDAITITTASPLTNGTVNVAYNQSLAATGGTGSFSWSLATGSGTLPTGLTLSTAGVISGTPTASGTFNFTVQARDSATPQQTVTKAMQLFVIPQLAISTASLSDGVVGVAYSQTLAASGGTPAYTFSTDTLPANNLAINQTTGEISGTPATAGTTNFQATVQDSGTPPQTASRGLSIRVLDPLVITTTTLPDGQAGVAYSQTLASSGGVGTKTWGLTMGSNALPAGLTLLSSGTLSGTPSNGGTFTFTVMVSDQTNPAQSDTQDLSLTIAAAPLVVTTTSLPGAVLNAAYSHTLAATGGTLPFNWTVSAGTLPTGLNLDASTGAITGTPTVANTFNFTVQVEDANTTTDTQDLSILVSSTALGRNDSIATATTGLSNGTHRASISPYTDANQVAVDHDFYQFTANANASVTIEIFAKRLGTPSLLDSVIEIVNSNGTRFTTCRDAGTVNGTDGTTDLTPTAFDDLCLNDDLDLGIVQDSRLEFLVPNNLGATVTFYVRVLDWGGRARPDFIYDLVVSGVN